jgi:hypothetical protein
MKTTLGNRGRRGRALKRQGGREGGREGGGREGGGEEGEQVG